MVFLVDLNSASLCDPLSFGFNQGFSGKKNQVYTLLDLCSERVQLLWWLHPRSWGPEQGLRVLGSTLH